MDLDDSPRRRPGGRARLAGGVAVLAALACGPCDGEEPRGTTVGELGNGTFTWHCLDRSDAACPGETDRPRQFPTVVAVGGRFEVAYDAAELQIEDVRVGSPTSMISESSGALRAEAPGTAALVAYRGDQVFDLVHVDLVVPTLLVFADAAGPLPVDAERTLSVTASDGSGGPAAGALDYAWEAEPAGLVRLLETDRPDQVVAIGEAPGEVRVIARVGAAESAFVLTVDPAPPDTGPSPDTGATGADTGPTGSPAETGADTGVTP